MTDSEAPEAPNWLSELERKREIRLKARLGHEAGAGAPCIKCNDKCPGLDLHFWRKICKNCKCSKEDHDVHDDDIYGWAQFQLLGSKPSRTKKKIVLPGKKDEVELEWAPKGNTDTIDQYLKTLAPESLPVKGSQAAQDRKQLLQKQIPIHDIDPSLCHELSESELAKFQDYIKHMKSSAGVGQIVQFGVNYGRLHHTGEADTKVVADRYPKGVPTVETVQLVGEEKTAVLTKQLDKLTVKDQKELDAFFDKIPKPHNMTVHAEKLGHVSAGLIQGGRPDAPQPLQSLQSSGGAGLTHPQVGSGNEKLGYVAPFGVASPTTATVPGRYHPQSAFARNQNAELNRNDKGGYTDPLLGGEKLGYVGAPPKSAFARTQNSELNRNEDLGHIASPPIVGEKLGYVGSPQVEVGVTTPLQGGQRPHAAFARSLHHPYIPEVNQNQIVPTEEPPPIDHLPPPPPLSDVLNNLNPASQFARELLSDYPPEINRNIPPYNQDLANSNYKPLQSYNPNQLPLSESQLVPDQVKIGAIRDISYEHPEVKTATQAENALYEGIAPGGAIPEDIDVQTKQCRKCNKYFQQGEFAIFVEKSNSLYHSDCFRCAGCNQSLADLFYFYDKETDHVYCGRDFAKIRGIPRCKACDELIFVKEYCLAENSTFHLKHFCCFECDQALAGQNYVVEDSQPVCLPCFEKLKANKCISCGRVIMPDEEGVSLAEGIHFHSADECFCCSVCRKVLHGGKLLFRNHRLYCSHECLRSQK